jgi:VWFA-related protein
MSPTRLALLLALLPIAAPQPPQQPSAPASAFSASQSSDPSQAPPDSSQPVTTLHITSRAVVLDVVVTDASGKPAHGLKPSDFTLTEDGVPQSLASFTEHVVAGAAAPTSTLPPNTFAVQPAPSEDQTKTVIVLVTNVPYVRDDIAKFLRTASATQPIAIVRLDRQGMHLVQGLTTDRKVLLEAIASKRILPPIGFPVHFVPLVGSPTQQLVRYVNSIPGRVNLVCVGGNPFGNTQNDPDLPNSFPDLSSVLQDLKGPSNITHLSRVALYPIPLSETNMWANQALIDTAKAAGGHVYFSGVRQALNEIAATGSDYYTISYVPTDPNWNSRFRKIKLKIAGFPQPPRAPTWSEEWSNFLGWTETQKSKVLYRPGYFARTTPSLAAEAVREIQGISVPPDPNHRLLSYSPRGDPAGYGAATARPLNRAMQFGSMPLDRINFTVVATPSANVAKLKPDEPLPESSFLSQIFRQDAYRDVHIHYWIDPHNLTFSRDQSGDLSDALQFVVVIYRDDGFPANSIATTEDVRVSADRIEETLTSGIVFDQTIAVPLNGNPIPGNFFLHIGVCERSSNRVGTIEVPTEWIKVSPTQTASSR